MGDISGTNEEPQKTNAVEGGTPSSPEDLDRPQGSDAEPKKSVDSPAKTSPVRMQHCFITLADGRRGVFMGPELIKAVEFKLGVVPRPVAIDFEPPREFSVPVPRTEEPVNADQKTDEKPAAGLE